MQKIAELNAWDCPAPSSLVATDNYSLIVSFSDCVTVEFDFKPYFRNEYFLPLKNVQLFKQAKIIPSAIIWNDDLDIAIEEVYKNGKLIDGDN